MEFYTSAILLKTVSAYELKAWLGINIVSSYVCNVFRKIYQFDFRILIFSVMLVVGIALIVRGQKQAAVGRMILLGILYITAKFCYGMMLGMMSGGCKPTSVLFIVMILTAFAQLPRINIHAIVTKKGAGIAAATRIPNAAGLICEAVVAAENVFLYAMVQPIQLAILFIVSLVKKEPMSRKKLAGSVICLVSVCVITVLV